METQSTWQCVIAERGWVYIGRVSRDGDQREYVPQPKEWAK